MLRALEYAAQHDGRRRGQNAENKADADVQERPGERRTKRDRRRVDDGHLKLLVRDDQIEKAEALADGRVLISGQGQIELRPIERDVTVQAAARRGLEFRGLGLLDGL